MPGLVSSGVLRTVLAKEVSSGLEEVKSRAGRTAEVGQDSTVLEAATRNIGTEWQAQRGDFHTSSQSKVGDQEQGLGHPSEDQRAPVHLIQQVKAERRV